MMDPHARNITVVTVFGVLIENGSVLMIRRAKEPYQGLCTVPGGHKLHGESLVEAAVREMREETGLTLIRPVLAGMLEVEMEGDGRDFLSLYYRAHHYEGSQSEGPEGELFWLPWSGVNQASDLHPAFRALAPYFQEDKCFFRGQAKVDSHGRGTYHLKSVRIEYS
ncbi:MAG: NUDIX domain-containing protein [Deltaproteobacteria bacterium]|jgi:8-oxo-dGTP diphosphatase|nr:NUDIX domain-containing protein [Deltaproteobacteria bacterium]